MSSSQPRTLLHRYTRLACRAANFSRHIYGVVYGLAYTTDHVIMGQSYRFMGRNLRTWQRSVKRLPFLVPFSISITSVGRSSFRTWADSRDKKDTLRLPRYKTRNTAFKEREFFQRKILFIRHAFVTTHPILPARLRPGNESSQAFALAFHAPLRRRGCHQRDECSDSCPGGRVGPRPAAASLTRVASSRERACLSQGVHSSCLGFKLSQ